MATFFTSDLHIGHKNIMKFCPHSRGMYAADLRAIDHQDVQRMNQGIIDSWNSRVGPTDDVWHLGDLTFFHQYEQVAAVLRELNGRIHHVNGNHDEMVHKHGERMIEEGLLYSIQDYAELKIDGRKVIMFHFPMAVWNKNHHGAFQLYGHCHGSFKAVGKQMDVGWDTKDLGPDWVPGPIPWEKVKECLDERSMVAHDHHDASRTDHEGKSA